MFLLAWPTVDSACVTKRLRLKRLMQRHVCCFSLKPVEIVVHHLNRCFAGRICPAASMYLKLAKPFLALSAQNISTYLTKHLSVPLKQPMIFAL